MERYGVATAFADDWGEALRMAMVEMWRHRAIAHGEMQTLNLKLPPEIANAIRPPVELICPRCSFRIVVFRPSFAHPPKSKRDRRRTKRRPRSFSMPSWTKSTSHDHQARQQGGAEDHSIAVSPNARNPHGGGKEMELDRLWKQAGDRVAEHLRREHGRGIYLEMQNAAWAFCCGLPLRVRCSECDFAVEFDPAPEVEQK